MDQLTTIFSAINGVVWGPLMLILLFGVGIYLQCLGGEGIKIPIRVHVLFPIFWILSIIQVMSLLEANAYFFFFEFFT